MLKNVLRTDELGFQAFNAVHGEITVVGGKAVTTEWLNTDITKTLGIKENLVCSKDLRKGWMDKDIVEGRYWEASGGGLCYDHLLRAKNCSAGDHLRGTLMGSYFDGIVL